MNSTPAIATRNERPAPSNETTPARQRNEVGRPMFSLVYDIQLSIPQRRTSAQLAMRHASTSRRRATLPSIGNASSQSLGGYGITQVCAWIMVVFRVLMSFPEITKAQSLYAIAPYCGRHPHDCIGMLSHTLSRANGSFLQNISCNGYATSRQPLPWLVTRSSR